MASPSAPTIPAPLPELLEPLPNIRGALPQDREPAWRLQQAAFSLPESGPVPHPGVREDLRVVVHQERVVSCLTLIHAELCMNGVRVPMGGIRHVATNPDEQNRGYASSLMRETLREMRHQGLVTSVLFPFSFRYYRKFGYELGGNYCHYWCRPNCIPAYNDAEHCHPAGAGDVPALARLYASRTAGSGCALVRTSDRWRQIVTDPELQVITFGRSVPEGYLVAQETRDSYGGRVVRIVDLAAETQTAWRGLLGWLSRAPAESIEWYASCTDLTASGLMRSPAPLREGFKPRGIATVRPMFQFRVVDVAGALQTRLPQLPAGQYRLALRVRDDLMPENTQPVAIQQNGEHGVVRPGRPSDPYLELDIQVFSQIFCGFLAPSEALAQNLGRCSSPAAAELADRIFASGEPFIGELDRF